MINGFQAGVLVVLATLIVGPCAVAVYRHVSSPEPVFKHGQRVKVIGGGFYDGMQGTIQDCDRRLDGRWFMRVHFEGLIVDIDEASLLELPESN